MLEYATKFKILVFAIPFLAIIIWHFIPQKKGKENQLSEEEKEKEE